MRAMQDNKPSKPNANRRSAPKASLTITGIQRIANDEQRAIGVMINEAHSANDRIEQLSKALSEATKRGNGKSASSELKAERAKISSALAKEAGLKRNREKAGQEKIDAYEAVASKLHPFPEWSVAVLRGGFAVPFADSCDRLEGALEWELRGEEYIRKYSNPLDDRRQTILEKFSSMFPGGIAELDATIKCCLASSLNNQSAVLRRLRRYDEAVDKAIAAYGLWPIDAIALNLVLALDRAGYSSEVDEIFQRVASASTFGAEGDVLTLYSRFEAALIELKHVPSVAAFLQRTSHASGDQAIAD